MCRLSGGPCSDFFTKCLLSSLHPSASFHKWNVNCRLFPDGSFESHRKSLNDYKFVFLIGMFVHGLHFLFLPVVQIVSWKHLRERCAGGPLSARHIVLCSNQARSILMMNENKHNNAWISNTIALPLQVYCVRQIKITGIKQLHKSSLMNIASVVYREDEAYTTKSDRCWYMSMLIFLWITQWMLRATVIMEVNKCHWQM